MICRPLFRILILKLLMILAVEDSLHIVCCQQFEPIHDVLLVDAVILVTFSVDLEDIGNVVVIRHLSPEIICCIKGRFLLRAELKVHFVLLFQFFE